MQEIERNKKVKILIEDHEFAFELSKLSGVQTSDCKHKR